MPFDREKPAADFQTKITIRPENDGLAPANKIFLIKKACEKVLKHYLTISNPLQWRLQYSRVIEQAGKVEGVLRLE